MDYNLARLEKKNPKVASALNEMRGTEIIFVPNNGNAGDSLIAAATYQMLRAYDISYRIETSIQRLSRTSGEIIVLGGGGNLVPLYSTMASVLHAVAGRKNRVLLLPHSIRGNVELLAGLDAEATLFCREKLSLAHTKRFADGAKVHFGHDLGLFLDVRLLEREWPCEEWRNRFDALVTERTGLKPEQLRGRELQCFRGGAESTVRAKGRNFDASMFFTFGVLPGDAEKASWMLLEFVRLGSRVITNRLHVAISALLSGIETVMLDNSYGKLSGVYESSIKDEFEFAKFEGNPVTRDPFQNK